MTHGSLGDYRRRRQRAVYWRLAQIGLFVVTLLGTASYAYQIGVSASQAKANKLETELERFQDDNLALRDRLVAQAERSKEAEAALADLEQQYRRDVPQGELRALMERVGDQIAAGVEPQRLALLIDVAGRPAACTAAPETKRFMPRTSVGSSGVHAVRAGDGRVLVAGEGTSARSQEGLAEAWFDPAEPVRLTFHALSGEAEEVMGVLPVQHRMIVDGQEYRFAVTAGERAFIELTTQVCALPDPEQAEGQGEGAEAEPPAVTSG